MEKDLIINWDTWKTGIGQSPIAGCGVIANLDIHGKPGILRLSPKATKVSGTTVVDRVKWMTRVPNGDIYALDESGTVYKSTNEGDSWSVVSGNTKTSARGNGLAYYGGYLFVARNTVVDTYDLSSTWTTVTGLTLTSNSFHPMVLGQDNILYIGNDRYIASIEITGTPNWGAGTGYNKTAQANDLPSDYTVKSMAELQTYLVAGTYFGSNSYQSPTATLFPWDRSSTSFNLTTVLQEKGTHQLVSDSNMVYAQAGTRGEIYRTNLSETAKVADPKHITIGVGESIVNYPGAACKHDDKFLFGLSSLSGNINPLGVYSIKEAGKVMALVLDNTISVGDDGTAGTLQVSAMLSLSNGIYLAAWSYNDGVTTTYGIDKIGQNGYLCTSYAGYLESPLYQVGTIVTPRTFSTVKMHFAKKLASGHGVRIKYRTSLSDNWTTLGTYDYATLGAVGEHEARIGISGIFLQLKIELTTGSSSTTGPELVEVRLR
jgi:hypothetical protein